MSASPMNVIFIMSDQQRADSIGPNRHPCANYPNMEALREQGVSFNRFYPAAIPCVPSRRAFLTGRHDWINGSSGNENYLMDNEQTWMSVLREFGYSCVSVGKTHGVHAGSLHIQIPLGESFNDQWGWNHFKPEATREREDRFYDIYAATRGADALKRLANKQPFALFLGFHAPHEPYVMPERYLDFCSPDDVKLPPARPEEEFQTKSEGYRARRKHLVKMNWEYGEKDVRVGIAGHHCLLKVVDDGVGRVMDAARSLGLLDNTLVVYCSDHGDNLGEHWLFNKAATFYEGEVRIPFILRFPDGRFAGKGIDSLASSIDFMPTLLEILGIDADVSLPGCSLMPAMEKGEATREDVLCATTRRLMIRTSNEKLWYDADIGDGEMYDLAADPDELNNLFSSAAHAEMRHRLTQRMLRVRMLDDTRNNRSTRRGKRSNYEMSATYDPEVMR